MVLLWLCFLGVGFAILEDVILIHLEGRTSSNTSTSVNVVRGSIAHHSSSTLSASWWGSPGVGGWAFSPNVGGPLHMPGLLWLHQLEVLAAKSHILLGKQLIPVQGMGCWSCGVIIIHFGCMASCFGNMKRCMHPPGKSLDVILTGNYSEFSPPGQYVQLLCAPMDPLSTLWEEGWGLRVSWRPSPAPTPSKGISSLPRNSSMWGSREGRHSRSSSSGLAFGLDKSDGLSALSLSPQVRRGSSLALSSSPGLSSKVTFHLNHTELGDWAHLLDESPWCASAWGTLVWWLPAQDLCWWLQKCLQLPEHQWPWLREWFNPSILSSSNAMAANACWWASLTTAKASSQDPCIISLSQS